MIRSGELRQERAGETAIGLAPDLAMLPVVVAQPWLQIGEGLARPSVEGAIFDRWGNLYVCYRTHPNNDKRTNTTIIRVSPQGDTSSFIEMDDAAIIGLAFHMDGRLFAADVDGCRCFVISPDGLVVDELLSRFPEKAFRPNDLAFDLDGNLYFNDFRGEMHSPLGGVYRLDASEDYRVIRTVASHMCSPNGLAFAPSFKRIWASETTTNDIVSISLDERGCAKGFLGVQRVYRCAGVAVVDSIKVDSGGNVYVCMMHGGRVLVLDECGIPVCNIVIPDDIRKENLFSSNLAFKPGTNEGYLVSSGMAGAWVYRFTALAQAMPLYSDR